MSSLYHLIIKASEDSKAVVLITAQSVQQHRLLLDISYSAVVCCEKVFEQLKDVRVSHGESVSQVDVS